VNAQPTHTFVLSSTDSEKSRGLDPEWFGKLSFLFLAALALRVIFVFIAPNNSTDAWSRYLVGMVWLRHPHQLPPATASAAWLPMHFWILGSVAWITKSEVGARCFSVLLGSFTVLLLAGIARRSFGPRGALWSAILLAFFGLHVAFSVTTSSEALTIFLMAFGLYAWIRCAECGNISWMLSSAAAFNIACLCRFEPWLCGPTLALLLVNTDSGSLSLASRRRWSMALSFGFLSSLGAIGWLIFSGLKWGDALKLPHRTMWLNADFQPNHHSVLFRALAAPGSIVISLSPVIAALGIFGAIHIARSGTRSARAIVALTFVLFAFNYYSSIRYETTQARYTLLYSWLIIPLAVEGLVCSTARLRHPLAGIAFAELLTFFILWQAGIATAAIYAPQPIADHLGAFSPMIPLHAELRDLTDWSKTNGSRHGPVILDDYNWESVDILRFGRLRATETFTISQQDYDDSVGLHDRLQRFIEEQHPGLLICSPEGPIGRDWCAGNHDHIEVPGLELQFLPLWQGRHWRIYRISYQISR
jgi:Dolichyl-phosphate-mannose-protein mannosyltransferase